MTGKLASDGVDQKSKEKTKKKEKMFFPTKVMVIRRYTFILFLKRTIV